MQMMPATFLLFFDTPARTGTTRLLLDSNLKVRFFRVDVLSQSSAFLHGGFTTFLRSQHIPKTSSHAMNPPTIKEVK